MCTAGFILIPKMCLGPILAYNGRDLTEELRGGGVPFSFPKNPTGRPQI
jgi:hypothetical protein